LILPQWPPTTIKYRYNLPWYELINWSWKPYWHFLLIKQWDLLKLLMDEGNKQSVFYNQNQIVESIVVFLNSTSWRIGGNQLEWLEEHFRHMFPKMRMSWMKKMRIGWKTRHWAWEQNWVFPFFLLYFTLRHLVMFLVVGGKKRTWLFILLNPVTDLSLWDMCSWLMLILAQLVYQSYVFLM